LGLVGVNVGTVPVCTYTDWTSFDRVGSGRFGSGWGNVRNHFGPNPGASWMALRRAANCSVSQPVIIGSGLPTLTLGNQLDLNTYVAGLGQVNVCTFPTFDTFQNQWSSRFGGRWDSFRGRFGHDLGTWRSSWTQLRQRASCSGTVVLNNNSQTIVQNPQSSTTVTEQAPAPVVSDPGTVTSPAPSQVATTPNTSKGVDTGDGSYPLGL
jgi:hypothetical protein